MNESANNSVDETDKYFKINGSYTKTNQNRVKTGVLVCLFGDEYNFLSRC